MSNPRSASRLIRRAEAGRVSSTERRCRASPAGPVESPTKERRLANSLSDPACGCVDRPKVGKPRRGFRRRRGRVRRAVELRGFSSATTTACALATDQGTRGAASLPLPYPNDSITWRAALCRRRLRPAVAFSFHRHLLESNLVVRSCYPNRMHSLHCALALVLLLFAPLASAGVTDGALDVYWIDVEGGGATLIVTPTGESILIDSGNPFERDPGRIHKTVTESAGLKKIDHLITTHFHSDHFGGAAELSALIPIGQVHDKGIPASNPDNNPNDRRWPITIMPYRNFKADKRNIISAGQEIALQQPRD